MKVVAVIPARYGSSRFPGKPLALIAGKPMIQWVYEKVSLVDEITRVYVATDDDRIMDVVIGFGGQCVITGKCSCGTDRVYEATLDVDADIILNIQGDEPLIDPRMIAELISAFNDSEVRMATLKQKLERNEADNPNVVKVVTDKSNDALLFSRYPIPYARNKRAKEPVYYKHIGIYGYRLDFLRLFVKMSKSILEETEQLEQLRVLENGYKIRVIETEFQSVGVDVPEDIALVERQLQ